MDNREGNTADNARSNCPKCGARWSYEERETGFCDSCDFKPTSAGAVELPLPETEEETVKEMEVCPALLFSARASYNGSNNIRPYGLAHCKASKP